jgi:glyoxylase-like metal-dependent hydrolase (beta-lactamase superfamily II)
MSAKGLRASLRAWGCSFVAVAGVLGFARTASAQLPDMSKVEYRTEKLTDNLFVLFGGGGNIAVLTGSDGALVVDSDVPDLSPKLRAALSLVTEKPARFLVNTHFHFDHTGGNPTLGRMGLVIIGHDNVRKRLMTRQVINLGQDLVFEPTAAEGWPVVTFADGLSLHLNGEEVSVNHVANGHTDSDAFVFFEKANVLHTGDLMMSAGYPLIDLGNGGSIDGLIAGHERMLALCNDQTRVIPGHGGMVAKADLQAYHDMVVTVRKRVADLVRKGRSQQQVQAAAPSKEFDERWGKGFIKPEMFVDRLYIDLSRPRKKG